jgi:hypothetical protein
VSIKALLLPAIVNRLRQAKLCNNDHFVQIIFDIRYQKPRRIGLSTNISLRILEKIATSTYGIFFTSTAVCG